MSAPPPPVVAGAHGTAGLDTLHVRVTGQVQGVGYRAFVRSTARPLGIAGWVCNHADGTVELAGQGAPEAIHALADALRRGPPAARVTAVEVLPDAALEGVRGFDVVHAPALRMAPDSERE